MMDDMNSGKPLPYFKRALKLHCTLNRASISPVDEVPMLIASKVVPVPVRMASSTFAVSSFPWVQVKVVMPVAFFTNSASSFVTSIETEGFDLCVAKTPSMPVLISAAMANTAKYVERKGFWLMNL